MKHKTELETKQLDAAAEFFGILRHPARLQIVEILEKGPKCVGDIQKILKIDQPPTSHHLKLLLDNKVLEYNRSGQKTLYSLVPGIKEKILKLLEMLG